MKLCGAEIGENCEDAAVVIGVGRERELGEDVSNVGFDGLLCEPEAFGDRPVAQALCDERQDFVLSVGQIGESA